MNDLLIYQCKIRGIKYQKSRAFASCKLFDANKKVFLLEICQIIVGAWQQYRPFVMYALIVETCCALNMCVCLSASVCVHVHSPKRKKICFSIENMMNV